VDTRSRTVDNFKKLGWIPFYVYDEVKINKCILVFKKLNGDVPSYIDKLFITIEPVLPVYTYHLGTLVVVRQPGLLQLVALSYAYGTVCLPK
jgi:hypothetical protein